MENKKTLKEWWSERTKKQKFLIIGGILLLIFIANLNSNKSKSSFSNSLGNSRSGNANDMIHRCGRSWNGEKDRNYSVYGDYCCERCYADLYPN